MEPVKHDFILQAGIFMGFAITSAVFGGIIMILYSVTIGSAGCQKYCNLRDSQSYDNFTIPPILTGKPRYSYDTKMGLAAVILTLGIIEFGTGIWVSICLCVMEPCCIDIEVSFLLSQIQSTRLKVLSQPQTQKNCYVVTRACGRRSDWCGLCSCGLNFPSLPTLPLLLLDGRLPTLISCHTKNEYLDYLTSTMIVTTVLWQN